MSLTATCNAVSGIRSPLVVTSPLCSVLLNDNQSKQEDTVHCTLEDTGAYCICASHHALVQHQTWRT